MKIVRNESKKQTGIVSKETKRQMKRGKIWRQRNRPSRRYSDTQVDRQVDQHVW